MKEVIGVPVEIGDWIISWFPGEGVTLKRIINFENGKPVVQQKNKKIECTTNYMKITDQLKINKKNYPELFI